LLDELTFQSSLHPRFLLLAHRIISLRCRIWLLSGMADIDQALPIKLD
jgi:hypothetical protein